MISLLKKRIGKNWIWGVAAITIVILLVGIFLINMFDTDAKKEGEISQMVTRTTQSLGLYLTLAKMKSMPIGFAPWRISYADTEKVIINDDAHLIAINITNQNKGIYSIIHLDDLDVAGIQGSNHMRLERNEDGTEYIIGSAVTDGGEDEYKPVYYCSTSDGTIKKIKDKINFSGVSWYKVGSKNDSVYAAIKSQFGILTWDTHKQKPIDKLPDGSQEIEINGLANIQYADTLKFPIDGSRSLSLDFKDNSTRLLDFEIVEHTSKGSQVIFSAN